MTLDNHMFIQRIAKVLVELVIGISDRNEEDQQSTLDKLCNQMQNVLISKQEYQRDDSEVT